MAEEASFEWLVGLFLACPGPSGYVRKVTAGLLVLDLLLVQEPRKSDNVGVDLFAIARVRHDAGVLFCLLCWLVVLETR